MRLFFITLMALGISTCVAAQPKQVAIANIPTVLARPKIIVGIVVDQMRWDYLYRYYDRYLANGAFKRLLNKGFTCETALIPYAPTVTAAGHACVYTGSVPAIHGIVGNEWWDRERKGEVYCTNDYTVITVGSATAKTGFMSPRNLLTTTVADELRIATNFRSKVIGIAIKDRGAILPAGHSANAAYWYDNVTGNWVTSTYYTNTLPAWLQELNGQKLYNNYYNRNWVTLYPIETYRQSTADIKEYEGKAFGSKQVSFPYDLQSYIDKDFSKITVTPYGNNFTLDVAKAAIEGERMGMGSDPDFLAISFSSPDYIGHTYGPNSVEAEDNYLRLDRELGLFFDYLDLKFGKGGYTIFLTADHGVAHVPGFNKEHKLPGKVSRGSVLVNKWNGTLREKFGVDSLIISNNNYQLTLNPFKLETANLEKTVVARFLVNEVRKDSSISAAFLLDELTAQNLPLQQKEIFVNGYYAKRSGDIQLVAKPGYMDSYATGTTHGAWNPYDAHIPVLFYGWGVKTGKTHRQVYMTDIAPTIAAILKIQMPSGCIGRVVEEAVK